MPWFTRYFATVVSPFLYTVIKKAGQIWRCLQSSHCVRVITMHMKYVSGEHSGAPHYLHSPPSVPYLTLEIQCCVFFLPFAISLFLFVSCAQQTVDSFCVMKVVGI